MDRLLTLLIGANATRIDFFNLHACVMTLNVGVHDTQWSNGIKDFFVDLHITHASFPTLSMGITRNVLGIWKGRFFSLSLLSSFFIVAPHIPHFLYCSHNCSMFLNVPGCTTLHTLYTALSTLRDFPRLPIFHTPHLRHSSFCTLLIFHSPHFHNHALRVFHWALINFFFLSWESSKE